MHLRNICSQILIKQMCEFASTLLARTNSVQISCSKFGIHLLSLQTWVNPFFRPVKVEKRIHICKCYVSTKYLVLWQLLSPYPRAILASNYGIISSYVDCTGSFLGCYEVEKRIDNSGKFLYLGGNILMSVLLKLLSHLPF